MRRASMRRTPFRGSSQRSPICRSGSQNSDAVIRWKSAYQALVVSAAIKPVTWDRVSSAVRARWHGQRLPAGNGPGTGTGLRGVGDGWEQPAQLDRGRELAALLVDGADRSGLSLSDDEHAGRMGTRTVGDKRPVPRMGSRGSRGTASRRCRKRAGDQGDRCCNRPTPLPRARSRGHRKMTGAQ
jgi:hypothetical protein